MSLYLGENLISGNKPINLGVRNIGEIVASSLPLTDAGLHLLDGSLILGGGIYQGFVDYIAGLQGEEEAWTQPVLTSNGTLGGNSFAVYASNNYDANTYPIYKSFDNDSSTIWYCSSSPVDVIFYNPKALNVTNIQCQNRTDAANYTFTAGTVYGSNDNSTWVSITTFTNSDTTAGGTYDIDLSSNTNYYKYYKISFSSASTTGVGANFTITATAKNIPSYFITEGEWQQSVTAYGVCGKFVYDSVNNTVRLPKITGIIEGTTDVSALGDLVEAGLPAMTTGTAGGHNHSYTRYLNLNGAYAHQYNNGCFGGTGDTTSWNGDHTHTINTGVRTTDTVQPQTIKAFYYIVIANSTKTEIQSDIDEIATDLNGKADVDLSNINANQSAKDTIISWGMPDYSSVITISYPYTCPSDGFITHACQNSGEQNLYINNNLVWQKPSTSGTFGYGFCLPVNKGDIISQSGLNGPSNTRFMPLKGAN